MYGIHTNIQRLHFKNQLIGAAQSQQQLWVTLFLWFFYDPTWANKIFHCFRNCWRLRDRFCGLTDWGSTDASCSDGNQEAHNIRLFLPPPKNRKIKQLQEWFIQTQTADAQVMEISKRNTLFDYVESFPAAFVGISPLHSLKTTTATVPGQQSDVSRATTTAFSLGKVYRLF